MPTPLWALLPSALLLSLAQTTLAADAQTPVIVYPWNSGPFSSNGNGGVRVTWGSNDCVNMTFTSVYPEQRLMLQCNEGLQGKGPPWTRVWGFNSTSSTGNGSTIFCVGSSSPAPPVSNTCRFEMQVFNKGNATVVSSAYSPDISLNIKDSATGAGTTYPLAAWTATSTSMPTTTVVPSIGTNTVSTTATGTGTVTGTGTAAPSASTSAGSSSGLSAGASAGIGVGVGLGVLALAGLGFFFYWRRRKAAREDSAPPYQPTDGYAEKRTGLYPGAPATGPPPELDGEATRYETAATDYKPAAAQQPPQELETRNRPVELPASPTQRQGV